MPCTLVSQTLLYYHVLLTPLYSSVTCLISDFSVTDSIASVTCLVLLFVVCLCHVKDFGSRMVLRNLYKWKFIVLSYITSYISSSFLHLKFFLHYTFPLTFSLTSLINTSPLKFFLHIHFITQAISRSLFITHCLSRSSFSISFFLLKFLISLVLRLLNNSHGFFFPKQFSGITWWIF